MKGLKIFVLGVLFVFGGYSTSVQASIDHVQLDAELKGDSFKAGDTVEIHCHFTNLTDNPIDLYFDKSQLKIEWWDSLGNPLSRVSLGGASTSIYAYAEAIPLQPRDKYTHIIKGQIVKDTRDIYAKTESGLDTVTGLFVKLDNTYDTVYLKGSTFSIQAVYDYHRAMSMASLLGERYDNPNEIIKTIQDQGNGLTVTSGTTVKEPEMIRSKAITLSIAEQSEKASVDGASVKAVQVAEYIYVLMSPKGGNVTVSVGDDGVFLIDDQLKGRSGFIHKAVKDITAKPIRFILNTHYHFDHSGGNEFFGAKGALIVAHDNVRERLSTEQFIAYFKKEMAPLESVGLPTISLSDSLTIHYNNEDIFLMHMPAAHTDGDTVAIFMDSNVIVAGDLIFNNVYPFIDTDHGGSIEGVLAGLDELIELTDADSIIVPGHGTVMNKDGLMKYRDRLGEITHTIEAAIQQGQSLEEVVKDKPTKDYDAAMGGGLVPPDAFVKIIYESLSQAAITK